MPTVITKEAAKAKAQTLTKGLLAIGVRIKSTQALDLIAQLEQHSNWATMLAHLSEQNSLAPVSESIGVPAPQRRYSPMDDPEATPWYIDNPTTNFEQRDSVPCNRRGTYRHEELLTTLHVTGFPYYTDKQIHEAALSRGVYSARLPRPALPADDPAFPEEDLTSCNNLGETRREALRHVLIENYRGSGNIEHALDEFEARGGFTPSWQR